MTNAQVLRVSSERRSALYAKARTTASRLDPPPRRDPGQWAERYRRLPPDSAEPGPWNTDRVPYMRPVYQAIADATVKTVVLVCGAQMSKTEALLNTIGWCGMDRGLPLIYVGPTEKNVRSVSNDRVRKMIRETPELAAVTAGGQYDQVTQKWIRGARIGFAWASSATELATHPCAVVLIDERDRMSSDVDREGDPVTLARARTSTYRRSAVVICSTPTHVHASPIWSLWEEGTMGMWALPCPECAAGIIPRLEHLVYDDEASLGEIEATAVLGCPNCGAAIDDDRRLGLLAEGRYVYHDKPGEDDPMHPEGPSLEPRVSSVASFWVSGLASPWRTIGHVARELAAARRSGEPERIQGVVNTQAGELYRMVGDRPAWEEVEACTAAYDAETVPLGCQVLVAGVDVQRDRLYVVVRGFGHSLESWLIFRGEVFGETVFDEAWIRLGHILTRTWGDKTIARMLVDSGYKPGSEWRVPEHIVYKFARRWAGLVMPSKGFATMARPVNVSELKREGAYLCTFDSDHFKSSLYHRIRWPQDQAGAWHVFRGIDREYCRQLVSEEVVVSPTGKRTWIANRRANHYLDAEVLTLVAARTMTLEALPSLEEEQHSREVARARAREGADRQQRPGGSPFTFFD